MGLSSLPAARTSEARLRELAPFAQVDAAALADLEAQSTLLTLEPGETLFREGDPGDALYAVITGRVRIEIERPSLPPQAIAEILPGECVGEMALLTRQPRTATAVAVDAAQLVRLPVDACERLMASSPKIKARLVGIALRRLPNHYLASSPLGGATSAALVELERSATWISIAAGQTLFRQGDPPDALYLLTHGSLEAVVQDQVISVISRGEFFGEMGLLLGEPRTATVRARRDAELIRIPCDAFDRAISIEPKVAVELARQLADRLSRARRELPATRQVCTVTVLPLDDSPETTSLSTDLATALGALHVGEASIGVAGALPALGSNDYADSRLRQWLLEQEDLHPYVVYAADSGDSAWSRLALRQADVILMVGRAGRGDPAPSHIERELLGPDVRAPVELVLLHANRDTRITGTGGWLSPRTLAAVHHIRSTHRADDLGRLVRSIKGTSVGLVLGGGGARGLAHLGVIRAMREAGVPIDRVGGTSMGAIVAGMCALGHDPAGLLELCRRHYAEGSGSDLTLPIVALRSARLTVRTLRALFGDVQIEDLSTPYFCVSADLTRAEIVVHDAGPLWLAVRASCAVPGVVPPVAYMGDLLVDGGLLNNLPADVMRQRGSGSIIAVDVSPKVDLTVAGDGPAEVSGWPQLWARMRPGRSHRRQRFPSIVEVLSRAVLLGSVRDSQAIGRQADLYLHPPVDSVPMGAFKSIDDIVEIGYRYASEQLETWLRTRELVALPNVSSAVL